MKKALIFDCDGVLADTERYGHLVAFNQAFTDMNLGFQWSDEEYQQLLAVAGGKERFRAYMRANPQIPVPGGDLVALSNAFHKIKSQHYIDLVENGKVPPRPGVKRLICAAMDAGWLVAIASTASKNSVQATLANAIGADNAAKVDLVLAGDIVENKKPAPDIYLLAVEKLQIDPKNVVVVEDSAVGAKSAAAAGLKHLVTVSTYTFNEDFPDASSVVTSLGDPGAEAELISGKDVLKNGLVTVESVEEILARK